MYCAAQVGVSCGLTVAVSDEVAVACVEVRGEIASTPWHVLAKAPFEHTDVSFEMAVPVAAPEMVLVDANFDVWELTVEVRKQGCTPKRMLAIFTIGMLVMRWRRCRRLLSSAP